MKYLVDVRIHDRTAAGRYLPDHLAYLNARFDAGDFLLFGACGGGAGGALIAEAPDAESLEKILAADPLKEGACATWVVTPFAVGRMAAEALAPKAE